MPEDTYNFLEHNFQTAYIVMENSFAKN